jgi:hypothetical protein
MFIPAPWAMEGGRGLSTIWGFGLRKWSKKRAGIGIKTLFPDCVKVFYSTQGWRRDGVPVPNWRISTSLTGGHAGTTRGHPGRTRRGISGGERLKMISVTLIAPRETAIIR